MIQKRCYFYFYFLDLINITFVVVSQLYPVNQNVGSLEASQTRYSDSDENSDEIEHGDEEDDDDDDDDDDDGYNPNQHLFNAFGAPVGWAWFFAVSIKKNLKHFILILNLQIWGH